MSTPGVDVPLGPLEIFPADVAIELKLYAEKYSWHCAKFLCRRVKRKEADNDKSESEKHFASFREKCTGLLSDKSCQDIVSMLKCAGWHAANKRKGENCRWRGDRKGYESDASIDKRRVEESYQSIVSEKELSETLAKNLRDMGYSAAWYAANTIFGHQEDAEQYKANLDSYYDKIHGEVNLAEILPQRPRVVTPGNVEALEILPHDVANELKGYAEKISWYCAKLRLGNRSEADADHIKSKNHFDSFQEKCKGLLSNKICDYIRSMLWYAASHAANTTKRKQSWQFVKRSQYKCDAASDKNVVETRYQDILKNGEISETLATNVKEMGWNAAWFAANTIVGRSDDALRDKANLDLYFDKIHGDVNLVAMNFIMEEAKILSQEPQVVSEDDLVNRGDVPQTMKFIFSMTKGKTISTSHTIGFSYGINTSFSAGFAGFHKLNFELSFSFSHSHTFEQSTSTGITTSFEFPLTVPPHSIYVAKGMVHEAVMDIPYELELDFGGTRRRVRGRWKGVACSKATYEIAKKEDLLPIDQTCRQMLKMKQQITIIMMIIIIIIIILIVVFCNNTSRS